MQDIQADAKEIAAAAMRKTRVDPRHTENDWSVELFGLDARAQLRLPIRDTVEVRRYLRVMITDLTALALQLDGWKGPDRAALLLTKAAIKDINQKINAYRRL